MDGLQWKTRLKWMIWGYHYFLETSISYVDMHACLFYFYIGFIAGRLGVRCLLRIARWVVSSRARYKWSDKGGPYKWLVANG